MVAAARDVLMLCLLAGAVSFFRGLMLGSTGQTKAGVVWVFGAMGLTCAAAGATLCWLLAAWRG
jgi:hypothetical protein